MTGEVTGRAQGRSRVTPASAAGPLQAHTLAINDVGLTFVRAARQLGHECHPADWEHEVALRLSDRPKAGRGSDMLVVDSVLHYTRRLAEGDEVMGSVWFAEHSLHLHTLGLADLAMGMAVAAGAALAPDLDEHQSLGGRANPISDLPLFGGHRTRTHTLLAAALVFGLALVCQRDRTAMAVFVGFMACTGSSVLLATVRRAGCFLSVPLGALAGYLSNKYLSAGWWLSAAVALPYLNHLAADGVTVGGVPLLMRFSKRRFSLG